MKKTSNKKVVDLDEIHHYTKIEFEKLKQASLKRLQKDMAVFTKTFQLTTQKYLENYFQNIKQYIQKLQQEKVKKVHKRLRVIIKNMGTDLK